MSIGGIQDELPTSAAERGWNQFHTPKNLSMALSVEGSELIEIFQWLTPDESAAVMNGTNAAAVVDELADVTIYLRRPGLAEDRPVAAAVRGEHRRRRNERDSVRSESMTCRAHWLAPLPIVSAAMSHHHVPPVDRIEIRHRGACRTRAHRLRACG